MIEKPPAAGRFIMLFSYIISDLILLCDTYILRNKPTPSSWVAPVGVGEDSSLLHPESWKTEFQGLVFFNRNFNLANSSIK